MSMLNTITHTKLNVEANLKEIKQDRISRRRKRVSLSTNIKRKQEIDSYKVLQQAQQQVVQLVPYLHVLILQVTRTLAQQLLYMQNQNIVETTGDLIQKVVEKQMTRNLQLRIKRRRTKSHQPMSQIQMFRWCTKTSSRMSRSLVQPNKGTFIIHKGGEGDRTPFSGH